VLRLLALLLLLSACAAPPPADVAAGEPAPRSAGARNAHAGALFGDKLLLFGGIANHGAEPLERPACLDLATGAWTLFAPQPTYRWFAAAVTLEAEVLLLGGGSREVPFQRVVEAYDPRADAWRDLAPLELARNRFAAVVLDGQVYAIGGYTPAGNTTSVEVYDPRAGRWRPGPPLNFARHGHAAVVQDGHIVVVGGYVDDGRDQLRAPTVEVLDPRSGAWTLGAPLPEPRGFCGAAVLRGELYVFQGRNMAPESTLRADEPGGAFTDVDSAPPHLRNRYVTVAYAGRAWLVGGEGHADGDVVVQAFAPDVGWDLPFAQAPR
jgi:hypothetical protein